MRIPVLLTIIGAIVGLIAVVAVSQLVIFQDQPLLVDADLNLDEISPNADGVDDVAELTYTLSRNADVSIIFEAEDGTQYAFRDDNPRIPGDYRVSFSGVVNGFSLGDEDIAGTIERRLIPDGTYTWKVIAVGTDQIEVDEKNGQLVIRNADVPLPEMTVFTVGPDVFTPNQDGIDDRVEVNIYLEKEADLRVYLVNEEGEQFAFSERQESRKPGESGRHTFDYEGGVDLGADPPPDGTYTVVAIAQDDEGQRIRQEAELTIASGGKPFAEIVPQTSGVDVVLEVQEYDDQFFTDFETQGDLISVPDNPASLALTTLTVPLGDMLVFKVTVENYGESPIRTTGPPPGTVYQQDQLASGLGWADESGAWRIGIECQTSMTSYPYRWAIGTEEDLFTEEDPDNGNIYSYLPPDSRSVVWGAIRMTDIQFRNPQDCWAGLIHEDVGISVLNNNVGRRSVELVEGPTSSE